MAKIFGIIPARYGSTRFPGKPLLKIGSKTMIEWTYSHAMKAKSLEKLFVATDDSRIFNVVKEFGGEVILTSVEHKTGTDRLIEVVQKLNEGDIFVNIQGDEPGIEAELIEGVIANKLTNRNFEMSTAAVLMHQSEWNNPDRVKVVFDKNTRALFFSRSLIPSQNKKATNVYKHLGIYAYERDFLLNFNKLPQSDLEESESLEQLRALDSGASIGVYIAQRSSLSIDSPEDVEILVNDFKARGII
ncbi:MAG: 3-deoxy-manno-octulosonate cytidylyltransferase [Leptospiraceae bacterium]|nr:3-deoxy-manno-octulosonate cytidylyltransferase [Leptospiraceae bacterium]